MKVLSIVSETCTSFAMHNHNHLPPCQQLTLAIAVSSEASPQLVYNYPAITTYTLPLVYNTPLVYKAGGNSLLLEVLLGPRLDLQTDPAFARRPQSDLCTIQGK